MQFANSKEKAQIKNGVLETEKKLFFKIGHVFEYTQTDAREKGMPVSEIFGQYHQDGVIENEGEMLAALHKVSKNIGFEILPVPPHELGVAKGVAYPYEKIIALNPRNTTYENVTTLLHELAHARLHTPDVRDSFTKAEMVSYVVASRYGIDTEDFSLSYLASWTKQGKELKDKEMLLNGVRTAASEFIETIDNHFLEIQRAKENELMKPVQLLLIEYGALSNASLRTIEAEDLKEIIHDIITNKVEQLQHPAFKQELDHLRSVSDNLLTFEQVNADFIQVFNNTFKDNFALINQQEVTNPKILIQWSESELMSNELMGFAEGNERMALLEKEVFSDKEKAYSYLKTRYHVLIPNGDTVDLVNPDRLDIGDGLYNSPYQQLLEENKLTDQQRQEVLKDLAAFTPCEKIIEKQLSVLRSLHYWRRNQLIAKQNQDFNEVEKSDQAIRHQLDQADEQNIPFKLQNEVLHHAEHYPNASFSEMKLNEILLSNYFLDNNYVQQQVTKTNKHQINNEFECLK
ncbi:LPD25 domain-containing protein [Lysinibacillus capsici]|uniref:LPD25 domain-containing protein n=1 Tax=Lysinibacillus capsici TaxID=2115968 RepID=UPI0039FBF079